MTLVDSDPFARATGGRDDITGGRYRLPQRDGTHKPGGWQRVSNLVGAYSDQFALRLWELEQMAVGIKVDYERYRELMDAPVTDMDKDARKRWVEEFTERCKRSSGGAEGTDFGINRHSLVENHHAGLPTGFQASAARRQLSLYASTLVRHRLRAVPGMQERRVLIEELECVGTLDNILEDLTTRHEVTAFGQPDLVWTPGDLLIADLKTQKRFWTYLEIAAQLACYAHATAMWDPVQRVWVDMPPVRLDLAKVLWMPKEHPSGEPAVDVINIDIEAGWATARRARDVVLDRAAAKSARKPRGWLAQAPDVTETERYAAMFAGVDSVAEGAALVQECKRKGIWSAVLADCAREAKERLASG